MQPLITSLKVKDYFTRWYSAYILSKMNSAPALDPLMESLKNRDLEAVAGAYPFYIMKGEPGTEGVFVDAFNTYANIDMANDYLNCGNRQLEDAVKNWANKNGYTIIKTERPTMARCGILNDN
jgi:HEAT repeat protein